MAPSLISDDSANYHGLHETDSYGAATTEYVKEALSEKSGLALNTDNLALGTAVVGGEEAAILLSKDSSKDSLHG